MSVSFPNPSRTFDEQKQRVCFWGYDGSMEITFFIDADALKRISRDIANPESNYLQIFDAAVTRIQAAANKVHKRDAKGSYTYVLGVDSF